MKNAVRAAALMAALSHPAMAAGDVQSIADLAAPWVLVLCAVGALLAAALVAMLVAQGRRHESGMRRIERQAARIGERIDALEASLNRRLDDQIAGLPEMGQRRDEVDRPQRAPESVPPVDSRPANEQPAGSDAADLETALCRLQQEVEAASREMRLPSEASLDLWTEVAAKVKNEGLPEADALRFDALMEMARSRLRVELIDPPRGSTVNPLLMEVEGPPLGAVAEVLRPGLQSADGVIRLAKVRSVDMGEV